MRYAGIGWRGDDFVGAVLDVDGPEPVAVAAFPFDSNALVAWLTAQQQQARGELMVAVDSTSGVLEGPLLATGLPVHRFDPWDLPPGQGHGSADPLALAEAARAIAGLAANVSISGWLNDRLDDLKAGERVAEGAELALRRSGNFIRRGSEDRREVALTFDDGPDPRYTHQVLEILARYGVVGTFFCVGLNARAHPRIVESIAAHGHVVANHTWSHPLLPDLSEQNLTRQVEATGEAIARVIGHVPRLVRPPYGGRNPAVLQQLTDLGMTTVVWDVDGADWACPGAQYIEKTVLAKTSPGSIVLLHDSGGDRDQTVAALPGIIESLLDDGYAVVPVEAMLG